MRTLKIGLLLALLCVGLTGCVYEEVRGGGYRHGWNDRGYGHSYDRHYWR